jgi:hypothetical protein
MTLRYGARKTQTKTYYLFRERLYSSHGHKMQQPHSDMDGKIVNNESDRNWKQDVVVVHFKVVTHNMSGSTAKITEHQSGLTTSESRI